MQSESQALSATSSNCENCGRSLPATDAVCPTCDQQLDSEIQADAAGKYRCPVCWRRFDHDSYLLFPRGAKWYWPRQLKPACPHCQVFLRDRTRPRLPARAIWLLVATTVLTYIVLPVDYRKYGLAALVAFYLVSLARLRERNVSQLERFVRDEA